MKLFNIRNVMVLVFISIHEARVSSTFFGGLKASRRLKLKKKKKKMIILENIKSNELSLVFSEIVSKGHCCDKVWGIPEVKQRESAGDTLELCMRIFNKIGAEGRFPFRKKTRKFRW